MSTRSTILTFIIWASLCLSYGYVYGQAFQLEVEVVRASTQKSNKALTAKEVNVDISGMIEYLKYNTQPIITLDGQEQIRVQETSIVSDRTQLITLSSGIPFFQEFPYRHVQSYIGKSTQSDFSLLQFGHERPFGYFSVDSNVIELRSNDYSKSQILNGNAVQVRRNITVIGHCADHPSQSSSHAKSIVNYKSEATKVISITMILDHAYVENNNGKESAIAKALGVINATQVNFHDEFVNNIVFRVDNLIISDCQECDPWSSTSDAAALLMEVNDWTHKQSYLQENNMIVFWTGRDLESDVIGSSHTGSLCSPVNTTVLHDVSDSPWQLRVLAAHEIGHALSSSHDAGNTTIMAAALNNSSSWSSGSKSSINTFLQSSNCLLDEAPSCPGVSNITATKSEDQLTIRWTGGTSSYEVQVVEMSSGEVSYDQVIEGLEIIVGGILSCQEYLISITPICELNDALTSQLIFTDYRDAGLMIVSASPSNCYISSGNTFYELNLQLNNLNDSNQEVVVTINGVEISLVAFPGVYNYNISGLPATGEPCRIRLGLAGDTSDACASAFSFNAPSPDCALSYHIDFNDCQLPDGWTVGVEEASAHAAYHWNISDSDRNLLNYGNGNNAHSSKTIDGTCMALIDDDVINTASHSGNTWLRSSSMNLSDYDNAVISFDYIFDDFDAKGGNDSYVELEVFNGQKWINVWSTDQGQCPWYNIWSTNCSQRAEIDISLFLNAGLQLRWKYSDGDNGAWSGMAAIDNLHISATRLGERPCATEEYYIVGNLNPEEQVPHARTVFVDVEVGNPIMSIEASETVIFEPGATVMEGTSISISITPCVE